MLLIGMKRQAKENRLPEWEEISAVAMSVQNMHLMTTSLERVGGTVFENHRKKSHSTLRAKRSSFTF